MAQTRPSPTLSRGFTRLGRFLAPYGVDNVFIERLWRSLKYECVYLSEFTTGSEARTGIGGWMDFYNRCRPQLVAQRSDA